MMTWIEKLFARFGFSLTEDLEQHKKNADFAFGKLARVEPELEEAKDDLWVANAELKRLRAEIAGHVRVIGALMDEVGERVPA